MAAHSEIIDSVSLTYRVALANPSGLTGSLYAGQYLMLYSAL
jgi:hypothetical protein